MPPAMLIESLKAIRQRVRWLGIAFGLGVVLCAAVGLMLTAIGLDYLLNLPALPRLLVLVFVLAGLGILSWARVGRIVLLKLSLGDIAGRIEQAFPQFQDRLRSTVNMMTGQVPGSDVMKQHVVAETLTLAQNIDLRKVVVAKPAWYSAGAGVGSIVLALLLSLLVGAQYTRIGLHRLLMPLSDLAWPRIVQIDLIGEVPQRVPVGQKVDVAIKLSRGDRVSRKALIYYQYADTGGKFGPVQSENMMRGDDGIYRAALDARTVSEAGTGSMRAWMTCGDDRVDLRPITVVQRLSVLAVQAEITPPPYARQPPVRVNLAQSPPVVTAGSALGIRFLFNKAVTGDPRMEFLPIESAANPSTQPATKPVDPTFAWKQPRNDALLATLMARTSMRFRVHVKDVDGFENTAVEEYEIVVRPDQNPSIQLENPRRNESRTPTAIIPMQAVAEDDFGIDSLVLVVDRAGDKQHWEIPLVQKGAPGTDVTWAQVNSGSDVQRYRGNWSWNLADSLADANLKPGDVLEYYLLVRDNFALDGQTHAAVPSGHLRINIISQDELAAAVTEELRQVSGLIQQVKNSQNRTQRETATLAQANKDKPQLDPADQVAAERLANQQSTAASQTKQLAAKVDDLHRQLMENQSPNTELIDTARDVANTLNNTAEKPMKDAANQLNKSRQSAAKDQRNDQLAEAGKNQQQSSDQLQKAMDRMGSIGSLSRSIEQIRELLAEQQRVSAETVEAGKNNLGKKPEEMNKEDRARLDKAAKDQAALAEKTAKTMEKMQENAGKLSKSDPASASAMKQAASTGQQQNVTGNQSKAAQSASSNQQAQAQSAQKQAELGLQMMLNDLREAERRKLAELAKKLEELQGQIATLLRRQASHNLDNLALQGGDRLAKLETKEKENLFTTAERDSKNPPPVPDLPTQSASQEQTERNARDIAKGAEDLPDGAEAADRLTEAANKMERAIVSLRDNKLAEACNPPQIEALAALQAAKKIIDEQKAKADQKQQDQQKEAIRQAYVKIREDQAKLNEETARLNAAPKLEDGSLHRADAVRLGQLPGEQGKLSDRTAKLEEDLSALGSIVYVWANKDIVHGMNDSKDDLGKKETGTPVQTGQKRVVAELDAMIRDLAIKPYQSKFATDAGGGGGGSCSPKMPSEAELRLLKDLQLAINDATKELDALAQKDKARLLSLGGRQGELRGLLDQLIKNATKGESKLGPEPDNKDQLPEEANAEDIESQELDKTLLSDKPNDDRVQKDMDLVGDRMARSRQRLALNDDPGKITQKIQERIVANFDDLIEQARKKEAQARNNESKSKGQKMGQPKPKDGGQPQNANANGKPQGGGNSPAQNDTGGPTAGKPDVSADIKQKMQEWGAITPRLREAVIEGASEKPIDRYKTLIDDYYRSLATKSTGSN